MLHRLLTFPLLTAIALLLAGMAVNNIAMVLFSGLLFVILYQLQPVQPKGQNT